MTYMVTTPRGAERAAVFPGSFDPFTFGHLDIVRRAMKIFDHLVVLVLNNPKKRHLFSLEERVEMIREVLEEERLASVEVDSHKGLLVEYLRSHDYKVVIRGLRVVSDFEYEVLQAHANFKLYPEMETVFLFTCPEYSFLSSTLVKELATYGADVSNLVPPNVAERLYEKLRSGR